MFLTGYFDGLGENRWAASVRKNLLERYNPAAQQGPDVYTISQGRKEVTVYLEAMGFADATLNKRLRLLNNLLLPHPVQPPEETYLRKCCGLQAAPAASAACMAGASAGARPIWNAIDRTKREAGALALQILDRQRLSLITGLGLDILGYLEAQKIEALDCAHLAYGRNSRRAKVLENELLRLKGTTRLLGEGQAAQQADQDLSISEDATDEQASTALARLAALRGLTEVKEAIYEVLSQHEINDERRAAGLEELPISAHLIFRGRPGTGKTTVARLYAQSMRHAGVLSRGHLVEVGRSDLAGC